MPFSARTARSEGRLRTALRRFDAPFSRPPTPRASRALGPSQDRRSERELGHPNQVAGGDDLLASCMGALDTEVPALPEAAGGFAPAEDLLDSSTDLLAEGVRIRADAHTQGSALRTGCRMRSDAAIADALDKAAGTVASIGAEGMRIKSAFLELFDLLDGDHRLRGADRGPDLEEDTEPVLVFQRRVARKAQSGLSAVSLAHQLRLRVRCRLVGVVLPALALEVAPAIAVTRPVIRALLLEALKRGP